MAFCFQMATKLKQAPRNFNELKTEAVRMGLLKGRQEDAKTDNPRAQLLMHVYKSYQIARSVEKGLILMVGTSGTGKSSTINHLFSLKDGNSVVFAKTSTVKSETRTTTEFVLECNAEEYLVSGLRMIIVDTPGFNDTGGIKQDACNFYSIKKFLDTNLKGCYPNLIFLVIQATDTRIQGENSNLAKSLRCMRELNLIDLKRPNVVGVVTWCTSLGENPQRYQDNIEKKLRAIRETILQFLEVNAPVVAVENDTKYLPKDGDYTVLPDGTRQEKNLYNACRKLFEKNSDSYGQIIFTAAFREETKKVSMGATVEAKNAETAQLSKDEQKFFEFFSKTLEGGIADPIIHEARIFVENEFPDSLEEASAVVQVASLLKKIGVETKADLKFVSLKGLNLLTDDEIHPAGIKFLKHLGVPKSIVSISQLATPLIGYGFNILNDNSIPTKLFIDQEVITKYGIMIPSFSKIAPVSDLATFLEGYENVNELMKARLSNLNVSVDINTSTFQYPGRPGFNTPGSTELTFLLEERLFEISLDMKNSVDKLSSEFKEDVKALPGNFQVNVVGNRQIFERFLNRWGPFVVTKAYGGGSIELKMNPRAVMLDVGDLDFLRGTLTAAFRSGYFDSNTSFAASTDPAVEVSGVRLFESVNVAIKGGSLELQKKESLRNEHVMDQWRNSLTSNPVMLSTSMCLEPISTLVGLVEQQKRECVFNAVKNLLGGTFKMAEQQEAADRQRQEQQRQARLL